MKIGILIVAYNAENTLVKVLDRIPVDFLKQIDAILVCDDASTDDTHNVGLRYQSKSQLPLTIVRHEINLGYGGNQKTGYQWALEKNLDLVVLLHGDGQYAPEYLPQMVAPIVSGSADVVFGSRMITHGGARQGGMPLYKFVGNKILTTLQNRLAKVSLTEWHSGYRAYSVASLRKVNFLKNSDYFDFDSQIILQMIGARQRIVEIEIPTFYGDEISRVNGIKYGIKILIHTLKFRLSSNKSYF
ncbi:MAG: glycosyltransferase family 2 protein [Actinobacteria bacterium]|nr:glycosyltransferase family 2 protein [Actinomycetota bacterium]NCU81195.1 glycosyltransferase family 2 protein [Acidimicrobiia bacterium]NDC91326.1 glycosyltransferase family 2 protein [Acidimicrobiia bacterium]NDD73026.1 glycosyltransferase family 2 protein [Actinomycetota bacterium]